MGQDYNYGEIEPDRSKDPSEWHYSHRRAWILKRRILRDGSVEAVNWSELAERFDKSKSTLHNDKQRLVDYLAEEVDEEEVRARGRALFEAVLRDVRAEYNDPENTEMTAERVLNIYRMWVKTLREFGQLPPAEDDPRHDTATGESTVPEEITVGVSGVEADRFDPDGDFSLPEQDRPDREASGETETERETETEETGETT